MRELFDFVTDPTIGVHNIEACLDRLIALADERAAGGAECVHCRSAAMHVCGVHVSVRVQDCGRRRDRKPCV